MGVHFARRQQDEVAALRARVSELEEELRQLRNKFKPQVTYPASWGLSDRRARLLHLLMTYDTVTREQIVEMANNPLEADLRSADSMIKRLRSNLRPLGFDVMAAYGLGYFLSAETKAAIRARAAAEIKVEEAA